jgi:hypothetical protein
VRGAAMIIYVCIKGRREREEKKSRDPNKMKNFAPGIGV